LKKRKRKGAIKPEQRADDIIASKIGYERLILRPNRCKKVMKRISFNKTASDMIKIWPLTDVRLKELEPSFIPKKIIT
jgi:hypothetical protein